MAFRHFAILFVAFGLLSAAASSSSSSPTEATSEISTTAEMTTIAEITHNAEATSEISTTAEITQNAKITHNAEATSEISTTAEMTTAAEATAENATNAENATESLILSLGFAPNVLSGLLLENNPNPATTTAPAPVEPAFEQTVVFEVTDLGEFASNFNSKSFAESAVEDSSTVVVDVVVAVKVKFTASYGSADEAKTDVASSLGVPPSAVEVTQTRRRLTSSTRRLSISFSVIVKTDLNKGQNVLAAAESSFSGVETEVSVTVQIFPKADETLETPPKMDLGAATRSLKGVDETSIDVSEVTANGDIVPEAEVDDSNSDLPWVFTAALAGTVALF